jgi:Spy/CpxP family protein refolding chaperone
MARIIAFVLVLGLPIGLPAVGAAASVQPDEAHQRPDDHRQRSSTERRIKWWVEEKSRGELGITDPQSAEIEQIFQSTLPTLRQVRKELDELESKLSQMIKDGTAPVEAITEHVERVEHARAEMNKRRTIMLYRIDRVLSTEQRAKLKAWHEREKSRRPDGGSSRR